MRYLLSSICLLLAACHSSDGDDGDSGANNGGSIIGANAPAETSVCAAADATPPGSRMSFRIAEEIEPNDNVTTATAIILPTPGVDGERVGALLRGSINDRLDLVDTFSFASLRSKTFFFKLCEGSCNTAQGRDRNGNPDSLDVSTAYFRVRDGTGSVLMATQTNASTENYGQLCVAGGVITYVEVVANNTRNASQNYYMSAMETR